MNKQEYQNTVGLQVESLPGLAVAQAAACFDDKKLLAMMPRQAWGKIRRVIITGCGDSYSAAGAMAPVVKRLAGVELCTAPDPMDFTRFYTAERLLGGCAPQEVLVVAVSASGSAARIVEILEKAKACGAVALLVCNNPASKGAKAAQCLFHVETPALCNTPGLRSYFASMVALTALGAFLGLCRDALPEGEWAAIPKALVGYVQSWQPNLARIDEEMFALAGTWKALERFTVVGDEAEYFSALFVEQKLIECASVHCTHADMEDWCHIGFFLRAPETVGTIFQINSAAPDFDRARESVRVAARLGRPTLVVADAQAGLFSDGAVVCTIPPPPAGYPWLAPVMDFVPGSLLAAYCAARAGKLFFGGRYDYRTRQFLPENAQEVQP